MKRSMAACAVAAAVAVAIGIVCAPDSPAQVTPKIIQPFRPKSHYCSAPNHIVWPAAKPVWELCWVNPPASSGVDGSGLELRHVFYKGKRVFWRAHVPVLNVRYDNGTTYRDWSNQLAAFEADSVVTPGLYATPRFPPKTVCDHPGRDAGTFKGVAVERRTDRLILTTQMQAGWYRYIQSWTFHLNGTIEPKFAFTGVENPHIYLPHNHHVYWRFDFDINGAGSDIIAEYSGRTKKWYGVKTETTRLRNPGDLRKWRVRDKVVNIGYEVIPGGGDGGVQEAFGGPDMWALHYRGSEIDDGGAASGSMGDAAHLNKYVNKEAIDGKDVVIWYRAGFRHISSLGHVGCHVVGPVLRPFGKW